MGVRKRDFQLIAIPFHYFVENRLIIHQRNHISSNCLSSPSNTKFTEHLVWNGAFLCVLQATLLKQETYTTLREDKAWKDQRRGAVERQNLHHEEQGPSQQKRKKKESVPLNSQMEPCLPLGISVEECSSVAEKQTFQSTSRCAPILTMCFSFSPQHALDLVLIRTCLFSLMTCKAVILTSEIFQLTSKHLSWAISLLFLKDTQWFPYSGT